MGEMGDWPDGLIEKVLNMFMKVWFHKSMFWITSLFVFFFLLCRQSGAGGEVFCLLFGKEEKLSFQLSKLSIGKGMVIINPICEGDWVVVTVLRATSPCIATESNWSGFIPIPFPETVRQIFCLLFDHCSTVFQLIYDDMAYSRCTSSF
jgi:hypothetical protein